MPNFFFMVWTVLWIFPTPSWELLLVSEASVAFKFAWHFHLANEVTHLWIYGFFFCICPGNSLVFSFRGIFGTSWRIIKHKFIKYIIFALCMWLFVYASFIHIICLIHQSLTQLYNWSVRFVPAFCWTLPSKIWVSTSISSSVSHKSLSIKNYHKNV